MSKYQDEKNRELEITFYEDHSESLSRVLDRFRKEELHDRVRNGLIDDFEEGFKRELANSVNYPVKLLSGPTDDPASCRATLTKEDLLELEKSLSVRPKHSSFLTSWGISITPVKNTIKVNTV